MSNRAKEIAKKELLDTYKLKAEVAHQRALDQLEVEVERLRSAEPEFLLDCMAGKLTTFHQISGYVSQLELQHGELKAEVERMREGEAKGRREENEACEKVVRLMAVAIRARRERYDG